MIFRSDKFGEISHKSTRFSLPRLYTQVYAYICIYTHIYVCARILSACTDARRNEIFNKITFQEVTKQCSPLCN